MSEQKKPFWARCDGEDCGHCWPITYLPMEMKKLAAVISKARCPMCAGKQILVAKQDQGLLQEHVG